jgi:hypothetical protein
MQKISIVSIKQENMMNDVLTLPKGTKTKQVRQIEDTLGACFPRIRFNYSAKHENGYCYIHVSYSDAVAPVKVKNVVKGFNITPYVQMRREGVKVTVERSMSERVKQLLLNETKSVFGLKRLPDENDWCKAMSCTVGRYIQTIFNMRDF